MTTKTSQRLADVLDPKLSSLPMAMVRTSDHYLLSGRLNWASTFLLVVLSTCMLPKRPVDAQQSALTGVW